MDKKPTYYIRLKLKTKEANTVLHQGFELVNIDYFINIMDELNIPVLPTIVKSGPYVAKGFSLSLDYECSIYGKYLVSIYHSGLVKKNLNIKSLLENPKKYISTSIKDNKEFNIKILSEKVTLSRGYGIFPLLNDEIIIRDIFYSFDEDEIKNKIIELFDKYNT